MGEAIFAAALYLLVGWLDWRWCEYDRWPYDGHATGYIGVNICWPVRWYVSARYWLPVRRIVRSAAVVDYYAEEQAVRDYMHQWYLLRCFCRDMLYPLYHRDTCCRRLWLFGHAVGTHREDCDADDLPF